MASGLHALGHDVRLFGKLDGPGTWDGLQLWGAARAPRRFKTPLFSAGTLCSVVRHRPDHLVSTHVNFGPLAHAAKRAFGTPYTLVAHGVEVHEGLSPARRAGLRAADRIVAVSSWTRRRVLELGVDPIRVNVLPNTFDDSRFTVGAKLPELVTRYNLQPDEKVVLTVVRLDGAEAYKGYDRIVQALPAVMAACGRVRFIIVGKGDDRARVEELVRKAGVDRAVTFAGFVPDAELADHYRLADVFAMPSTGEGFGIVFLEALACGTPTLGGNADGSVDALDEGRLGRLVDPSDVQAIAAGIVGLLRREGPDWWFDRRALHDAVTERFGRAAFRSDLRKVLSL